MHKVVSNKLRLDQAQQLADALEEAFDPEPCAVSIEEVDEAAALWVVEALYDAEPNLDQLTQITCTHTGFEPTLRLEALAKRDWVAESLKGLPAITAGRFLVHGAHDRDGTRTGGISIEVDAGTAFGTGHHGTTLGCLLALDALLKSKRPSRALDIGCGTGVLGIATAKAANCLVLASDLDPEAVRVTRLNAENNRVNRQVRAILANGTNSQSIRHFGPYDLIFANILAKPLIGMAPSIAALVAANGNLILSGLTIDQEKWVIPSYRIQGLTLVRRFRCNPWSTLVLQRA